MPAPADASPEERRRILQERARALAEARLEPRREGIPVLAFSVGGERYAVDVAEVSQILESKGLWPLPGAPRWLLGAMLARSRVIPVLDLRRLLGLEGGGLVDLERVVVVEERGDAFGIAAESVEGRIEVPSEGLTPPARGPFRWLAPDRLALLDLSRLGAEVGAEGG